METVKLLIADDNDDNRLILRFICRKLAGLTIYEAVNGADAVEKVREYHPHIVLMDMMMPVMGGIEATIIIKSEYPSTVVMALITAMDPKIEVKLSAIGISSYIRKPIDKELIRFKLSNYVQSLQHRHKSFITDNKRSLMHTDADKPRPFKILYTITSSEALIDFGIWLLGRFDCIESGGCTKIDNVLDCIYGVIRMEFNQDICTVLTITESFEAMHIHLPLHPSVVLERSVEQSIYTLGASCVYNSHSIEFNLLFPPATAVIEETKEVSPLRICPEAVRAHTAENGEKRVVAEAERQMLRESFTIKTTAAEYISSIDSDTFGEVRDLQEIAQEWEGWLDELSVHPSVENFGRFADEVLGVFAHAIGRLYEFAGLSYGILSLSSLIKSHAPLLASDAEKRQNTLMFLGYFKNDLSAWIEHLFELQDAEDIHYLDCSLYSSCMQIETIINGTQFDTGEEGEMEFF